MRHATKLLEGRLFFVKYISATLKLPSPLAVAVRLTDIRMSCFRSVSSVYCTYTMRIVSSVRVVVSFSRIENGPILIFFQHVCSQCFLCFTVLLDSGRVLYSLDTWSTLYFSFLNANRFNQCLPKIVWLFGFLLGPPSFSF